MNQESPRLKSEDDQNSFFPLHQIKVLSYPSTASLIGIPKLKRNRALFRKKKADCKRMQTVWSLEKEKEKKKKPSNTREGIKSSRYYPTFFFFKYPSLRDCIKIVRNLPSEFTRIKQRKSSLIKAKLSFFYPSVLPTKK